MVRCWGAFAPSRGKNGERHPMPVLNGEAAAAIHRSGRDGSSCRACRGGICLVQRVLELGRKGVRKHVAVIAHCCRRIECRQTIPGNGTLSVRDQGWSVWALCLLAGSFLLVLYWCLGIFPNIPCCCPASLCLSAPVIAP